MCYNDDMKRLAIISGVSGAGKTTASNYLEDKGYRCIDQYPLELIKELVDLLESDNSFKYENVALTISLNDLEKCSYLLSNGNFKVTLILIDADKEVLINRYKFTRRIHPLLVNNIADTLSEAIDIEKSILEKYRRLGVVIDTTSISNVQFRKQMDKALNDLDEKNLTLSFVSFGFKNGVPQDCDNIFDVRFLDNPFYDPDLKVKTGNDKEVTDFVLSKPLTKDYLKKLIAYVDFMVKSYEQNEEKRHLTICIGCTGGQHRSVVITNYLYDYYKKKYVCHLKHRELDK